MPDPEYYGWRVAGIGMFCAALSGPGQSYVLSLYLEPLMETTSLGRFEMSSLYSVVTLLAALLLPIVGARADRSDGGNFLATVLLAMAGALGLLAMASGPLLVGISMLLLRLLGQGAVGVGTSTLTVRWFERRRGRALALVLLGFALGELVFPAILPELMRQAGWRGSLLTLAAFYGLAFAPLVGWAARDPSVEEQLREAGLSLGLLPAPAASYRVAEALRTPVFWGLVGVLALSPFTVTAVVFHQVALFRSLEYGSDAVLAAMAGMAVGGIAGTFLAGPMLERLPTRAGVFAALILQAAGLALPILLPVQELLPWLYGLALGTAAGVSRIAASLIWPEYFGTESMGAIKGIVNLIRNASTAAGPPVAALLLVRSGGASMMLLQLSIVTGVSAVGALFLSPPRSRPSRRGRGYGAT